jgi:transposase
LRLLTLLRRSAIKKIRQFAVRDDIDLWFEDECHFEQHGSSHWVPPEDVDPVLFHAPTRKSAGVAGAVRVMDGRLMVFPMSRFDGEGTLDFLKQLMRHHRRGKRMLVILDNARWHHARIIKPWLEERMDRFQIDFLPPYSPDLNPMERVWKLTRRLCTHNRYFPTLDELVDTVFDQLYIWSKPNDTLRKLCAIT